MIPVLHMSQLAQKTFDNTILSPHHSSLNCEKQRNLCYTAISKTMLVFLLLGGPQI